MKNLTSLILIPLSFLLLTFTPILYSQTCGPCITTLYITITSWPGGTGQGCILDSTGSSQICCFDIDGNGHSTVLGLCNANYVACISSSSASFSITGTNNRLTMNYIGASCSVSCDCGGSNKPKEKAIEKYELQQNYPNPFNPVTKITFSIPAANNVKLVVYDLTGKIVATLMNEYKNIGTYSVEFDASNLSSGIYLYKVESGTFTEIKKMLLVK